MNIISVLADAALVLSMIFGITFVVMYPALFNPFRTTAGRLIYQLIVSLVILGLEWLWQITVGEDNIVFQVARLLAWSFVAVSMASLCWLLIVRKVRPDRVKTSIFGDDDPEYREPKH